MAKIKVTNENRAMLESKTNSAYEKYKQGVETKNPALISKAEREYKDDVGQYLSRLVIRAAWGVEHLRKGGKRAKPIEKYILQHLLNSARTRGTNLGELLVTPDPTDSMGGLKAFLDAVDAPNQKESEAFKLIQYKATEIRSDKRYYQILAALTYVREQYAQSDRQKP